jgi:hypothetical protein
MKIKSGYAVYFPASPKGRNLLALHDLTPEELTQAIDLFEQQERVTIGTRIGIGAEGFIASKRQYWTPHMPGAFKETFIWVPWVQIFELLGRLPNGAVAVLFDNETGSKH